MNGGAVLWIRDGVLVNRMHVNSVSFAVSYWVFANQDRSRRHLLHLEDLVNFGFEKSGVSCAEKMAAFNRERADALACHDIEQAADFYNRLATLVANSCSYFKGALDLLKDLQASGARHFITSAVEQPLLDAWLQSEQGLQAAPYLTEVFGRRENFAKGRDHFAQVKKLLQPGQRIIYVADAVSEISTGSLNRDEFNLVPIGFASAITAENVLQAFDLVREALGDMVACEVSSNFVHQQLVPEKLVLPDAEHLELSLLGAGAEAVATGNCDQIIESLRDLIVARFV